MFFTKKTTRQKYLSGIIFQHGNLFSDYAPVIVDTTELVASSERIATTLETREEIIAEMSAELAPVNAESTPVNISEKPASEVISPIFIASIALAKAAVIASASKPRFAIVCIRVLSIIPPPSINSNRE